MVGGGKWKAILPGETPQVQSLQRRKDAIAASPGAHLNAAKPCLQLQLVGHVLRTLVAPSASKVYGAVFQTQDERRAESGTSEVKFH